MANRNKSFRSNKPAKRASHKSSGGWFQKILLAIFVLLIFGGAGVLFGYYKFAQGLPALVTLDDYLDKLSLPTKVYDIRGRLIAEFFTERRIPVPPDDVPKLLRNAFIAIEDQRYFQHKGVDYRGIMRAFYHNIMSMEMKEGGSTITQQLARSYYLSREKTFGRKIREAILAIRIEKNFSKEEIVTIYLNQIYLAHGAYGIGAAADEYFGKTVDKLTLGEMAVLAALPKEPSKYDPFKHSEATLERRNLVLAKMQELGMITEAQATAAKAEKIVTMPRIDPTHNTSPYFTEFVRLYLNDQYTSDVVYRGGLKVYTTIDSEWDVAGQKALKWGLRRIDRNMGWRGPDKNLQGDDFKKYLNDNKNRYDKPPSGNDIVECIVVSVPKSKTAYLTVQIGKFVGRLPESEKKFANKLNMEPFDKAKVGTKPRSTFEVGDVIHVQVTGKDPDGTLIVSLEQIPLVQGALLSFDPYTGEVRSMVGGYDFARNEFNRAIKARRQSGSAFKPIVYTTAIESNFNPATVVNDTALMFEGWKPKNYDMKFSGPQTLAYALQRSINTISVRITMDVGVDRVIKYARQMGVESEDLPNDLSLALGTATITLLELTRAYGVLASEGKLIQPTYVRRVYDRKGAILEDRTPRVEGFGGPPQKEDAYRKWLVAGKEPTWGPIGMAYRKSISQDRGKDVLDPKTAYVMVSMMQNVVQAGTGTNARLPGMQVAGKTGTTSNYRDALFVGFTTQLLTGVWVGYDDPKISLGHGSTGGDLAAPIWQRFMRFALEGRVISEFTKPDGVVTYTFDFLTGTLPCPDSKVIGSAAFKDGTQPGPCVPTATAGEEFLQQDLKNPVPQQQKQGPQQEEPPPE